MATRKKVSDTAGESSAPAQSAAFEAAIKTYARGIEQLAGGDFAAAKQSFAEAVTVAVNEPELIQRARSYVAICERNLAAPPAEPVTAEERYSRAVFLSNSGEWDAAVALFDQVLAEEPTSVRSLYARACTWALKGSTDHAVADLRRAITVDPTVRFQAVNDPDFAGVREEPAFIDIIEPTPASS